MNVCFSVQFDISALAYFGLWNEINVYFQKNIPFLVGEKVYYILGEATEQLFSLRQIKCRIK